MSVWRPLFVKCIILDHKLQRMLNDSKIAQLNSERPLHQTAVPLGLKGPKYAGSIIFFCRLQVCKVLTIDEISRPSILSALVLPQDHESSRARFTGSVFDRD